MSAKLSTSVRPAPSNEQGFTFLEILIVIAVISVIGAIAIPGYLSMTKTLRIAGDSRDLNATIALAKMRAAQAFTHARVHADLVANTYALEVWDKSGNGGVGCWTTEGDAMVGGVTRCTQTSSPAVSLSSGVSFGFAGVSAGNPNPQPAPIQQAPACYDGVAGGTLGNSHSGTACIEFNSRGVPVASNNSLALNDALYITDQSAVFGVTVIPSGLIQIWYTDAATTAWEAR